MEIYINDNYKDKLKKYKKGDKIKFCSTVKKTGIFFKVLIENASIIS